MNIKTLMGISSYFLSTLPKNSIKTRVFGKSVLWGNLYFCTQITDCIIIKNQRYEYG